MRVRGNWHERVRGVVASRNFFGAVLGLFALESLWFAFTFRHPMLYDETYHFGLIKLYAHQLSPFIANQPVSADQFGDVVHYPSFLYHWLMSLPYQSISSITNNEMAQVISLRVLNVAMVAAGLWLFRKVLLQLKLSKGLSNLVLLLFVLLPIVPMLSAQISYDNMLFLLTAASLYLSLRLLLEKRLDFVTLAGWLTVNMAACLVKFTFLPVFAAELAFLVSFLWRRNGRALGRSLVEDFKKMARLPQVALVSLLLVTGGLFGVRYGYNMVVYHNPSPSCEQVLPASRCAAYGPWARNEDLAKTKGSVSHSPVAFTVGWLVTMYNDFFRVATNRFPDNQPEYSTILPIVRLAATLIILVGLATMVYRWRDIHESPALYLILAVAVTYVAVLWFHNYEDFLFTGDRVGTQGRYLLPLVLPMLAVFGYVMSKSLHDKKLLKVNLAIVAIPLFLQGGGMFAGIVASQPSWYWQNHFIIHENENLQKLVRPFVTTKL